MAEEETAKDGGAPGEESGKRKWPKKPPKTEEDLVAIALLDALRDGTGYEHPEKAPLACLVRVIEYADIPKAKDAYALVRVEGPGGNTWHLTVYRGTVGVGDLALFISDDAALPVDDRFRNDKVCSVKEKTYKFGFGMDLKRLLPHVKRHIYHFNSGVLFPASDFKELRGHKAGTMVDMLLHIDSQTALKERLQQPRGKVWRPPKTPERKPGLLAKIAELASRRLNHAAAARAEMEARRLRGLPPRPQSDTK
ncbi:MAG: hypothetical protein IJK04_11225 [Kiritimatiellae bacterium]|nr:hypothetical protein [Kiritimatiellia bacterium]MBR0056810.1 hypothetical protein [Kiritimatiellia bacterium]